MSANTRRRKKKSSQSAKQQNKWLAQLASLFATAIGLIVAQKRSVAMVEGLILALQYFKENRLQRVESFLVEREPRTEPEFQVSLSKRWEDSTLPAEVKEYLARHGVVYVGEIFQIEWGRLRKHRHHLLEYLKGEGIPINLDPRGCGWSPPYWDDPEVANQLLSSIDFIFKPTHWGWEFYHRHGEHYLIQIFPCLNRSIGDLLQLQKWLRRSGTLHAGMLLPPGLKAPDEVPESWTLYHEEQEALRLARMREREEKHVVALRMCREHPDKVWKQIRADFSVRAGNFLDQQGIALLRELVAFREEQMVLWDNFGRITLKEITKQLDSIGLRLGMSAEEIEQVFGPLES